MKSGFATPIGNIELKREEILPFATDYCNSINSVELTNFKREYNYINPDYEFLLRVLKWIQVGSLAYGDDSYIIDDNNSLGIYKLESNNYFDLRKKETKKLISIPYMNNFRFLDSKSSYSLKNGFILHDGTVATYFSRKHVAMSNALVNYYSINNEKVNEYLKDYDPSCYEDLLVTLFGFLKVGTYGDFKAITYAKNIINDCLYQLIYVYKKLGFDAQELSPLDPKKSEILIKSLRK